MIKIKQPRLLTPDFGFGQVPVTLFEEQNLSVDQLVANMNRKVRRQILGAATGAGKTVMAAHMMQSALGRGYESHFYVDRHVLLDQASETLTRYGIPHSFITDGKMVGGNEPVKVCMQQTAVSWIKRGIRLPPAQLNIVDEVHTQYDILNKYLVETGSYMIGLTATPFSEGLG